MPNPTTPLPSRSPVAKRASSAPTSNQALVAALLAALSLVGAAFVSNLPIGHLAVALLGPALLAVYFFDKGGRFFSKRPSLGMALMAACAIILGADASGQIHQIFAIHDATPFVVLGAGGGALLLALLSRLAGAGQAAEKRFTALRAFCFLSSAVVFLCIQMGWLFNAGESTRAVLTLIGVLLTVLSFGTLLIPSTTKGWADQEISDAGAAMLGGSGLYGQIVAGVLFYLTALWFWGAVAHHIAQWF